MRTRCICAQSALIRASPAQITTETGAQTAGTACPRTSSSVWSTARPPPARQNVTLATLQTFRLAPPKIATAATMHATGARTPQSLTAWSATNPATPSDSPTPKNAHPIAEVVTISGQMTHVSAAWLHVWSAAALGAPARVVTPRATSLSSTIANASARAPLGLPMSAVSVSNVNHPVLRVRGILSAAIAVTALLVAVSLRTSIAIAFARSEPHQQTGALHAFLALSPAVQTARLMQPTTATNALPRCSRSKATVYPSAPKVSL